MLRQRGTPRNNPRAAAMRCTLILASMAVAAQALRSGGGHLGAAQPSAANELLPVRARNATMPRVASPPLRYAWSEQCARCAHTRMQAVGQSVQWRDALGVADCRRVCGAHTVATPGEERLPVAGGPPAHYLCAQRGVYGAGACA
jgi:hypothetical protein